MQTVLRRKSEQRRHAVFSCRVHAKLNNYPRFDAKRPWAWRRSEALASNAHACDPAAAASLLSTSVPSHPLRRSASFPFLAHVFIAWNSPHCKLGVGKRLQPYFYLLFLPFPLLGPSWRHWDSRSCLAASGTSFLALPGRSSSDPSLVRTLRDFLNRFVYCLQQTR